VVARRQNHKTNVFPELHSAKPGSVARGDLSSTRAYLPQLPGGTCSRLVQYRIHESPSNLCLLQDEAYNGLAFDGLARRVNGDHDELSAINHEEGPRPRAIVVDKSIEFEFRR
jgi:hypothetical protein